MFVVMNTSDSSVKQSFVLVILEEMSLTGQQGQDLQLIVAWWHYMVRKIWVNIGSGTGIGLLPGLSSVRSWGQLS